MGQGGVLKALGGDDLRRIPEIVCDQEGGQGEWGFLEAGRRLGEFPNWTSFLKEVTSDKGGLLGEDWRLEHQRGHDRWHLVGDTDAIVSFSENHSQYPLPGLRTGLSGDGRS